ncbi:DUF1837 domain-containing protein [bacterium]|nr:DUF1837 domain-containing protein [bacterium]
MKPIDDALEGLPSTDEHEELPPPPFSSHLVMREQISEAELRAYHVGFDQNVFRLKPLVDVICSVIPEFVFGLHQGATVDQTKIVNRLREAAKRVYTTDKYGRRGEFGELILHLLLRDFCGTIPLISKIYFKDSDNSTVHGFDGVHVVAENATMWLGESKIYTDGAAGIASLLGDLENHLKEDYLRREFSLISTKVPIEFPDRDKWILLLHEHQTLDAIVQRICLPMVCTYTSPIFDNHTSESQDYIDTFVSECRKLKTKFDEGHIETDIDVILMLLPIPSKEQLVTTLDERLRSMQQI